MLHKDEVVVSSKASLLHKVVFPFHLNQDIVLPSLYPASKPPKEISLHCLDVVDAVCVYFCYSFFATI